MSGESSSVRCEVFGIGSPHGVDQVGWMVLDRLQRVVQSGLGIHRLQTPLDLLAFASSDRFDSSRAWILIDACLGDEVGRIHSWHWPQVPESGVPIGSLSSHGIGLMEVLGMGQQLGLLPSEVWIYGIEVGTQFAESCQQLRLDPSLEDALRSSINHCAALIADRSVARSSGTVRR
jgi:hydrogenase maturation protease